MIQNLKPYPAYRDSGVEWLGEVPTDWEIRRVKWLFQKMDRPVQEKDEVVTCFRDGMVTLRKNRRERGFTESLKEIGYQGVRQGDLVVHGMDAFAGAVGVSDSDGKCTPVYSICRPTLCVNARFYAFIVNEMARTGWITALAKGIRERSTDFRYTEFASQEVPLPSIYQQSAIVRFLDHADRRLRRAVRAKRQLIALLNEQKQAIIHRAVTRGLDSDVPLKPSGVEWLGEVPAHWEVTQLRRRWEVIDCKHLTVPFVEEGTPLASVCETQCFDLDLSNANRTTEEWYKHLVSGDRKPKRGDIIYCRNVCVGASTFVCGDEKFAMGQDVCLIRSISENGRFLNNFLHSEAMRQQLSLIQIGSTFNRINVSEIKSLLVVIPPRDEQDRIVFSIDASTAEISRVIAATQREIDLLLEFRTRLIADVVTGKLDVREAAAGLPDEAEEPALFDEFEVPEDEENELTVDIDGEKEGAVV